MSTRFLALFVGLIFVADRWTKVLVESSMSYGESIPIIENFFSLTYVRNRGAAFGLGSNLPESWRIAFFVAITVALLGVLGWMLLKTEAGENLQRFGLAALIGGAAGNLYDRVATGEVVDFLDVYVGTVHWPAFNVADSFITVGAVLLVIDSLFSARAPE